ncbi:MAG: hypothetical protein LC749_20950, partial [Actinobacteria bacterium]|nr:hypothetical protein [Actinomycetota bacterium]
FPTVPDSWKTSIKSQCRLCEWGAPLAVLVIPEGVGPVKSLPWGGDLSFRFLRRVLGVPS